MKFINEATLNGFWKPEHTFLYLRHCLAKNRSLDAAVRLIFETPERSQDFIKLLAQNDLWDHAKLLSDALGQLNAFINPEIDDAYSSILEDLPKLLSDAFGKGARAYSEVNRVVGRIQLLNSCLNANPQSAKLVEIAKSCEILIQKQQKNANEKIKNKEFDNLHHLLNSLIPEDFIANEHEKSWRDLKLEKSQAAPDTLGERYTKDLPEERSKEIAVNFLQNNEVPKVAIQRKNVFRYFFGRHYIFADLPDDLAQDFIAKSAEAQKSMSEINIEWLGTKTPVEEKLAKLHSLQCLCPPHPLIDFCTAFLEARHLPSEANLAVQALIQVEMQIPSPHFIMRRALPLYTRLSKLIKGLKDHVSSIRTQHYIDSKRLASAIPFIAVGLTQNTPWAIEASKKHLSEIDKALDGKKEKDKLHFAISSSSTPNKDNPIGGYREKLAQVYLTQANKSKQTSTDIQSGLVALYRSFILGVAPAEQAELMKFFLGKFMEQTQMETQELAFKVGDMLGEAMSKTSVITMPSQGDAKAKAIGERLTRLYDLFKDVLLQQGDAEKTSQDTLQNILGEAKKMIQEADSIHEAKSNTLYEDIIKEESNLIKDLLFNNEESILNAVNTRYIFNQTFLEREFKNGEVKRIIPEHIMMKNYAKIVVEIVRKEIQVENNPLLLQIGPPMENFLNFGQVDLSWWENSELALKANTTFTEDKISAEPIVQNDRFVISHTMDWIRFENEEALKVPFRKGMSVVCTHLTEGLAACRRDADNYFRQLVQKINAMKLPELPNILIQLRKANYQITSLDQLKSSGFLPPNYDRSIEPRVRNFIQSLTKQLLTYPKEVTELVKGALPRIYLLDKHEFKLGMFLKDKEKSLKKYLHANLDELTKNYLKQGQKNSIPTKIEDVCIRVQQGINTKKNEMRNVRYSPILVEEAGPLQAPSEALKMITKFEDNFPIIDRITGSRQTVDTEVLTFNPQVDGATQKGFTAFLERVNRYLDNAQKLARQLRIIIMPGIGAGSYEPSSNSLCLPLRPGTARSRESAILSALADYLFQIKFVNESSTNEDELIELINKKMKSSIKPGTTDSRIRITEFINREIHELCGIAGLPGNPPNISSLLIKIILGSDNTMIYRELRNLSAPQKSSRYVFLRDKYKCLRRGVHPEEGVREVLAQVLETTQQKKINPRSTTSIKIYHALKDLDQYQVKDEIYDLGVLLFHYEKFDESYLIFELLTQLDPQFAEAYWGLGTVARSPELTAVAANKREAAILNAYRSFIGFDTIGNFWKKRADDIIKKLSV